MFTFAATRIDPVESNRIGPYVAWLRVFPNSDCRMLSNATWLRAAIWNGLAENVVDVL